MSSHHDKYFVVQSRVGGAVGLRWVRSM